MRTGWKGFQVLEDISFKSHVLVEVSSTSIKTRRIDIMNGERNGKGYCRL
jgi:hypothetical protein